MYIHDSHIAQQPTVRVVLETEIICLNIIYSFVAIRQQFKDHRLISNKLKKMLLHVLREKNLLPQIKLSIHV